MKVFFSERKYNELMERLRRMVDLELPENRKVMQVAIDSGGGMHDNADYEFAEQRQNLILAQISALEEKLRNAEIIDFSRVDINFVSIGARVKFVNVVSDEEWEFLITGSDETDLERGHISYQAPLVSGLIGKRIGDRITVETPQRTLRVRIVAIGMRLPEDIDPVADQRI